MSTILGLDGLIFNGPVASLPPSGYPFTSVIDALEFTKNTGDNIAAGSNILITLWNFGNAASLHDTTTAAFRARAGSVEANNTVIVGHSVAGTHEVLITDTAGNKLWANQLVFS